MYKDDGRKKVVNFITYNVLRLYFSCEVRNRDFSVTTKHDANNGKSKKLYPITFSAYDLSNATSVYAEFQ